MALTAEGLPRFDASGGLWIRLTVCGVTRLGYGHAQSKSFGDPGSREKEVIGDALRNAGMRFGAALDLWHKGDLHADKEEQKEEPKHELPRANMSETQKLLEAEKIGQEQTPEELAVWLLAGFDNCKTAEDVETEKNRVRLHWSRLEGVTNMKKSVVACAANARARIRKEREPGSDDV
jgi:hypothetical protein